MSERKVKIEKNVSLPSLQDHPLRKGFEFPFADMEIGDSFLVSDPDDVKQFNREVRRVKKSLGMEVQTKSEGDGVSVRVWRIA